MNIDADTQGKRLVSVVMKPERTAEVHSQTTQKNEERNRIRGCPSEVVLSMVEVASMVDIVGQVSSGMAAR